MAPSSTDRSPQTRSLESRLIFPHQPDEHEDALEASAADLARDEVGIGDASAAPAITVVEEATVATTTIADEVSDVVTAVGYATSDAASLIGDAAASAGAAVQEAAPSRHQLKRVAARAERFAEASPFRLAATGAVVGFVAGMLLPRTSLDEKLTPHAEAVVDQARSAGHAATEHGKQAVREAAPALGGVVKSVAARDVGAG